MPIQCPLILIRLKHTPDKNPTIKKYILKVPSITPKIKRKYKKIDRRRGRTCNLLIRSQAPCHWASRPC
ncbi:hypothetical protein N7456_007623 [Penicillium angulare]|uniref:Uncharacterized protein n=1 Tax=Penicillium angulare TaxID=116970 RepID=A0A9W9K9F6_9EURO|nr:hypothetical protein N7456_007623 [Penicillium angulare]